MNVHRKLLALLAMGALALAGCLEAKREITLNPDGSGKVLMANKMQIPPMLKGNPNFDADTMGKEMAREMAANLIESAQGIEAWTDVAYKMTDDGRMFATGVGYFKDVTKTQLEQGEQPAKLQWKKHSDGGMVLEYVMPESEEDDPDAPKPKLSDEQIDQQIKMIRQQYKAQKAMMGMMLKDMRIEQTFHLPGKVKDVRVFKKLDENTVQFAIDGNQVLAVMDKIMADEDYLRSSLKAGQNPMQSKAAQDRMAEELFGGTEPPMVHVTGKMKPQFDYDKEVAAAKEGMEAMMKELKKPREMPADADGPAPGTIRRGDGGQ